MDEKTLDEALFEDARPNSSRASATRHSERSRSHRSSSEARRVSRRLMLGVALAVSLLVLICVIVFSALSISGLNKEIDTLRGKLDTTQMELSQTGPELERAKTMVAEMVKGRLPNLQDLVLDKVININGPYLKNIVFTVLNNNGTKSYEYKLVMENNTSRTIHPAARIFVFDRYGVQIGSTEVAGRGDLAAGESRSQSSGIDRFINEEPRYFYISTSPSDKPTASVQ